MIAENADSDLQALRALNHDYIAAVQNGDVSRFDEILDEDFYCSNPDGTLVDREEFLVQTSQPVKIRHLRAHDVLVRLFGDVALIHGRTTYNLADGHHAHGRYTDVWARRESGWKAVAAHVTRG